ncbi:MAG: DUF255 domain-containing protein [Verrucomicrobiales bacterium]
MSSRFATLIFCFAAAVLHTGCGIAAARLKLRRRFPRSNCGTPPRRMRSLAKCRRICKTSAVDWMPWGDAAFAKAKAEDKPVLVSVGYDGCRWTAWRGDVFATGTSPGC